MTWAAMKQRCSNPKNPGYKNWGGRGIKVCDRWLNSFENFHADMGDKPEGMSIERINNDGDYCPENCKWVSHKENCRNTRKCRFVEYNGEKKSLGEWCEILGISRAAVNHRVKLNLTPSELFQKGPRHNPSNDPKRFLTFQGKTLSVTEWAKILGIKRDTLARRCYNNNFDPNKCLREISCHG